MVDDENLALERLSEKIKPINLSRSKKGKKFADKDFMLLALNKVNEVLEERSSKFFDKESEIIKAISQRDRMRETRKQSKIDKLNQMKTRISDAKKKVVGGKGDHRKFEEIENQSFSKKNIKTTGKSISKYNRADESRHSVKFKNPSIGGSNNARKKSLSIRNDSAKYKGGFKSDFKGGAKVTSKANSGKITKRVSFKE